MKEFYDMNIGFVISVLVSGLWDMRWWYTNKLNATAITRKLNVSLQTMRLGGLENDSEDGGLEGGYHGKDSKSCYIELHGNAHQEVPSLNGNVFCA